MTRTIAARLTSLLAAIALAACGSSSDGGPPPPPQPGPPSGAHSSFAASPAEVTADGVAAATLTAVVRDAADLPVPGVEVAFSAASGTLGATTVTSGADGVASTTLTSTLAGGVSVSAAAGAEALGGAQVVTFVPGPAAALVVTSSPAGDVAAGATFGVTVEIRDAFANRVTSSGEPISLALQGGAAPLLGTTSAATVAGQVSFADLSVQVAGSYQLVASAAGLTPATSGELRVVPAAAAALVVTSSPAGDVAAGAPFGVTVEVRDAFANRVTSGGEQVTLTLQGGAAPLLGTTSATAALGEASFADLAVELAGSYQLVASAAGLTPATSGELRIVPAAAAALAVTASPAGDVTAGAPFGVTVQVRDAFGNLVGSGLEQIALALQGGNPAATLLGVTSATAVLGEASFADLNVDLAGTYQLRASSSGLADATSGDLRIVAAAADPANSAVAASPDTQAAGANVALTATVHDFFGNPVEGAIVTFATAAPSTTFGQPPATDAAGVAAGTVTSTLAQSLTVSASVGGGAAFAGTAGVTFVPAAPSAATSTLLATPSSVDADGIMAISLVATVKDEFGNAVPAASVTLSASGEASFTQPGPTDASGVSAGAVTSTAVGAQTISAAVGAVTVASADVTFLTTDPDGDGVPNREDAFPQDPNRFAAWATVLLPGLGGSFAAATAVNAGNVIVGLSEDGQGSLSAAIWSVSGTTASAGLALEPLAGNTYSAAYAVDASGAAVGESEKGAEYVPVLWAPGTTTPTELGLGSFGSPSAAYGIADGRIVGEATSATATVAVLWSSAAAAPVELASLGGDRSAAYAVAGSYVVGESTAAPGGASVGAVWTLDGSGNPGAPVALAPLAGHVSSVALGVDAAGRIVGESEPASGAVHAVYWTVAAPGAPVDLETGSAQGVNAGGRVAGHGGVPVGPLVWDVRNPALVEGVLEDPFLFSQAYGLNGANVVVGSLDGGAFAAVPVAQ